MLDLGRPEEAVASFRRAIALAPRYLEAHRALVAAHLEAGDRSRAEGALARLEQLAPQSRAAASAAEPSGTASDGALERR